MNFYVMQGEYIGGFVRLSDTSIINVSAGGGLAPVYYVEA